MPSYTAPIRDLLFVYHEVMAAGETLAQMQDFGDISADLVHAILEEAGKISSEVLQPVNQSGDEEACQFNDGVVTTPDGFKAAYQTYVEGGWPSLACSPEFGGQGLPEAISFMVDEIMCSGNVSFALYQALTRGAINAIQAHASDALKQLYLPKMVSGEWAGCMCLTESHAGTDLGLLRTRAEAGSDGSYAISGTKIFITGGEQDMSENIVHLVLARLPDAPEGVRGISLFLVPKHLPDAAGEIGKRNTVHCGSIEHKMGIKASSTCVMNFDGATGFLVGPENQGLPCMFTMMNLERLGIGMQGLSLAEVAYQNAVTYAKERLQSRALTGTKAPQLAADPILVHPDVRRMLLTTRAYTEGSRALYIWTAMQIDTASHHSDAASRQWSDDMVSLMTPIIKAFFSDYGYETSALCQQVFGGHGYVREWGMEQFVRDARIAQIYEGTNGIQALDLVRRKLTIHDGRLPKQFFAMLDDYSKAQLNNPDMQAFIQPLQSALNLLQALTEWLGQKSQENADELGAASTDYLRIFALVTLAWCWCRMAETALTHQTGDDSGFYATKLTTARFFMGRLLPQIQGLDGAVRSGADLLMTLDAEHF